MLGLSNKVSFSVALYCVALPPKSLNFVNVAARRSITLAWHMSSVHKHLLAVAREKGHVRSWQGRGTVRLDGVTDTLSEMGYVAQRGKRRI